MKRLAGIVTGMVVHRDKVGSLLDSASAQSDARARLGAPLQDGVAVSATAKKAD